MYLTLEIVSANGARLGDNRRKVMGAEGGLIGRGRENEWVIDDPHVSRQHARVRCVNGIFFIEGLGKNPIACNDPEQVVPNNQPQALRTGDRFFIDYFEVRVAISGTAAPSVPPTAAARPAPKAGALLIPENPFAEPASMPTETVAASPTPAVSVPQGWDSRLPVLTDDNVLDPLAVLGGSPGRPLPELPPVNWQQSSPLSDSYRPPEVLEPQPRAASASAPSPSPSPTAGGGMIPDQWDLSRITQIEKPAMPSPPRPTPGVSRNVSSALTPGVSRNVSPAPPPPQSTEVKAQPVARPTPPIPAQSAQRQPAPSAQPVAVSTPASAASGSAGPTAKGGIDLDELLRAAGVSSTSLSPETSRELGEVLHIVIEGVMEVLRARAEIKSQFRMPVTRVQASENNPLKFSPNVEAALHTLLAERNRGYMPAPRAFEDAFEDIRGHQLAVLEGIRSAFNSMLACFEPQRLQADFERHSGGRAGLLNLGAKSRLWDQYTGYFRSLAEAPDDSFRRLFGDEFAEAYERQLERLKTARRNTRR